MVLMILKNRLEYGIGSTILTSLSLGRNIYDATHLKSPLKRNTRKYFDRNRLLYFTNRAPAIDPANMHIPLNTL